MTSPHRPPDHNQPVLPSPAHSPHPTHDTEDANSLDPTPKGKAVTKPVPIRPSTTLHDLFDIAPSSFASSSSYRPLTPTPPPSTPLDFPFSSFNDTNFTSSPLTPDNCDGETRSSSKGKGKDAPPILPPLTFSDMGLNYDQAPWPSFGSVSSTPAPSSYGSLSSPVRDMTSPAASPPENTAARSSTSVVSADGAHTDSLRRLPSRCRSLSSISIQPTPSLASLTISKIKVKLGPSTTTQSNLARKLLLGKRIDNNSASGSTPDITSSCVNATGSTSSSSLDPSVAPWYAAPLQYDLDDTIPATFVRSRHLSADKKSKPKPSRLILKSKGRSNSSPVSFSALDFVPVASTDIFKPLPLFHRNYIDQVIPKELRIQIFKSFIQLFEKDHATMVAEGRWTISKATSSKYQLTGRDRGIKELFRLSRVSRSWRTLVLDGQLWADLDLHSFPALPRSALLRLTSNGGPFIRRLNFTGHVHLQAATLTDIANHLCLRDTLSYTHLTAINLQGCSALTTRSLHHLLVRCRTLEKLCLKGLTAVTNTTCELLATFCTRLVQLNLNRCPNMDAEGIRCLSQTTLAQGEILRLKELRISGLKHIDDATMRALGKAAPHLEILDLSYIRQLHNSALEAFVAVDETYNYSKAGVDVIRLNARQIGRDFSNDQPQFYNRRVTKLRHLTLSFCILLTDMACSNIAYSVPHLEFLEMAGIGADLKDDGLIRLLDSTPHLRRLDLEDATDITDSVLACITPVMEPASQVSVNLKQDNRPPQLGYALEWLVVSHAGNLSDEAFLTLVRGCPKLQVLEADNTKLSGSTLKEFVHLVRQRKTSNTKIVAIDCRGVVGEVVRELAASGTTRPRMGIRAFWARRLGYVDGRDEACEEDLKVGQDECDSERVVVKTFYSWQTVDAVRSAREKRRRATSRRAGSSFADFSGDPLDNESGSGGTRGGSFTRWWSPSGRSGSGSNSPPIIPDLSNDGCIIM